jgi:hypothetical protein
MIYCPELDYDYEKSFFSSVEMLKVYSCKTRPLNSSMNHLLNLRLPTQCVCFSSSLRPKHIKLIFYFYIAKATKYCENHFGKIKFISTKMFYEIFSNENEKKKKYSFDIGTLIFSFLIISSVFFFLV